MLSDRTNFNKYLYSDDCPSSVMSSEQVADVLNMISGPCPVSRGAERQRYYRMRKDFDIQNPTFQKYCMKQLLFPKGFGTNFGR